MLQVEHTYNVIINSNRLMLFGETAGVYCQGRKQSTNRTTLNSTTAGVVTNGLWAIKYVCYLPCRNKLYKYAGNINITSDHNNN